MVILRDRAAAEDAVQDAMLRAWSARATLRDLRSAEAWLRRILVNECRDRLRARGRHPVVDLAMTRASGQDEFVARAAEHDHLASLVARLPPDDQTLLALRYARELTVTEIAAALGVAEGTVKSRLHRVLERIRAHERDTAPALGSEVRPAK